MLGRAEMLRRVAVRRIVAAADVAAHQAQPQVHPAAADREALLATVGGRHDVAQSRSSVGRRRFHSLAGTISQNSFSIVASKSMLTLGPPAALSSMVSLPASRCGVSVVSLSVTGSAVPEYWTR